MALTEAELAANRIDQQEQAKADKAQKRRKRLRVRPRRQAVPNVNHSVPNQKVEPQ